jgi:transposase
VVSHDLAADATRLANRLRDALTSIAPVLERAVGERLGQAGVRDLLAKYPTLTALRGASQSPIERTIKARSPRIAGKVSTTIAAALAAQDVPAEAATGRVISELDRVSSRRDALAEIEEAFLSCPSGELLASMPGIGPRTGARILAEIGDGSAFTNGRKLAAYAGLAPVTRQSGTTLNGETRSRHGNHRLKRPSPAQRLDKEHGDTPRRQQQRCPPARRVWRRLTGWGALAGATAVTGRQSRTRSRWLSRPHGGHWR